MMFSNLTKIIFLISLAVTQTRASFWIYATETVSHQYADSNSPIIGYGFFEAPPDCDFVMSHLNIQRDRSDVSGTKQGMRCRNCFGRDGNHAFASPRKPVVMEWNNAMGHFSKFGSPFLNPVHD
ncbi:hypothetical protein F4778DRAFT_727232 [Xylariomycetidae sp. FL2044]|nr:hypothetical protein F4778DRAFT_727232 [Xylariomycetidae sp. FL2044]